MGLVIFFILYNGTTLTKQNLASCMCLRAIQYVCNAQIVYIFIPTHPFLLFYNNRYCYIWWPTHPMTVTYLLDDHFRLILSTCMSDSSSDSMQMCNMLSAKTFSRDIGRFLLYRGRFCCIIGRYFALAGDREVTPDIGSLPIKSGGLEFMVQSWVNVKL